MSEHDSKSRSMRGTLAWAAFLAVQDGMRRDPFLALAKTFYDALMEAADRDRMLAALDPSVVRSDQEE